MHLMIQVAKQKLGSPFVALLRLENSNGNRYSCFENQEVVHSMSLNGVEELFPHLLEQHSDFLEINQGDEVKIEVREELEIFLALLLKARQVYPLLDDEHWHEFIDEDVVKEFGLVLDRVLVVNGFHWGVSEYGTVVPFDNKEFSNSTRLASIGFWETASMSSGWDSVSLTLLKDDLFKLEVMRSESPVELMYFSSSSKLEAVLEWFRHSHGYLSAFLWNCGAVQPFVDCMSDLLESEDFSRSYWGLDVDSNDEQSSEETSEQEVGSRQRQTPASSSAEWSIYFDKSTLDVVQILEALNSGRKLTDGSFN